MVIKSLYQSQGTVNSNERVHSSIFLEIISDKMHVEEICLNENIVDIKMTVQFRIQEPEKFLFNVKEPGLVLKQVTESAIREVIGLNKNKDII